MLRFGTAWPKANIVLIDKTTEVAPGVRLIAQISDAPGTKELKELSLAINTAGGIVLIVGCSHPGIEAIVAEATAINPRIRFVGGGFHLLAAQDAVIEQVVTALRDTYKVERIAPGHCSGEHTFWAVQQIFGDKYQYAGVGTVVQLRADLNSRARQSGAAEVASLRGVSRKPNVVVCEHRKKERLRFQKVRQIA